ncbi:MAG: VWA domain-containing protein [Anaerolineae bacterium]|nr:VWA domain-containing protein [Anaerolineae bacterium]
MSFLTPLALIAGLLAIPILLLYMLRLRRREVTVSSTFLWQQILQDREANTPWQKLRRNLLLFLQLLILALLVLALARPFVIVPAVSAGQIAVLLDASASMNATDSTEETRFDEAKQQALDMVNTMNAGDLMTVIRVADQPEVLSPYTGDALALREAIQSAEPSHASADWNAALTLAAAGAAGAVDFNVVIISDGGGMLNPTDDSIQLPAIPGDLQYIPVGTASSNVAVTALATRALPGEAPQLFAQITNYGGEDARVIFNLRVDGTLYRAEEYTIPANGSIPLGLNELPETFTTLQAGVTLPSDATTTDYLADDNTAWAVNATSGGRRALVMTEGNLFIEQVLRSLPGVEAFRGDINRGLPIEPFDLYVFDGWLPATLPDADMLFINPPRSTGLFAVGAESTGNAALNPRVRRDDPRMTFVDFATVNILKFKQVTASWADALISVDGGALLLAGEQNSSQIAILTFDLRDSDLPLQITFPILMSALLDWFTPPSVINAPDGLNVGDTLPITVPPGAETVNVTYPDGTTRAVPGVAFTDTAAPGLYTVTALAGAETVSTGQFAVNVFDAGESRISPRDSIILGDTVVTTTVEEEIGQREFWSWLALGALLVLLIEWIAYHRRMTAPTLFKPLTRRSVPA